MQQDIFIRRIYTLNGISVVVEIDLLNKTISFVEKLGNNTFQDKKWEFAKRGPEFLGGWQLILKAMEYAVVEAAKVLESAKDKDMEDFVKQLSVSLKDKKAK